MNLRCLNVGCGERFHPEWTNLDMVSAGPQVQAHDLTQGIPFSNETFDAVYHSHVLEHLGRQAAEKLLRECYRVLKHGGIVRVAVPDLERIARLYLQSLESAEAGASGAEAHYDWMLLELYDQTVRVRPGGEMLEGARNATAEQREFLRQRLGGELDRMLKAAKSQPDEADTRPAAAMSMRRALLRLLVGSDGVAAYDLGRFRLSGEVHQWMYDRFSLRRALLKAGFNHVRRVEAAESAIAGWASFHLDTEPDGSVYKPDSIYMEALRA